MEAINLWMVLLLLARKVRAGQLFYIPGRVIAFPDLTDMLYSINASPVEVPVWDAWYI